MAEIELAPPAAADRPGRDKVYRVWLSEVDGDRPADAEREWGRLLQAFPDLLGQHQPLLRRVDLGADGVRYRVLAGPFDARTGASALCHSIQERSSDEHCMVVLN